MICAIAIAKASTYTKPPITVISTASEALTVAFPVAVADEFFSKKLVTVAKSVGNFVKSVGTLIDLVLLVFGVLVASKLVTFVGRVLTTVGSLEVFTSVGASQYVFFATVTQIEPIPQHERSQVTDGKGQ